MPLPRALLLVAFCSLLPLVAKEEPETYEEKLRPRFHFTADRGWLNDPNGLIYVDGVYHLFFQHERPQTRWGHATSRDLIHWKQHEDAIVPERGHLVYSGSAVMDRQNTSGFQTGKNPPLVAIFTSWGEGQCLAFSNDKGKTWTRYEGNPVLKLTGDEKRSWPLSARDPHVMWHEDAKRWIMVLYRNPEQREDKKGAGFSFFFSSDLKSWTEGSHVPGFYVCPDVFEMQIQGEATATSWVAMDWSQYRTGDFDGEKFVADSPFRPLDHGNNLSANQSWKHLPDGRIIQICWLRNGKYPGMPFNQQLSFPTELSLRRIGGELRLCKNPIPEIESIHGRTKSIRKGTLEPGKEIDPGLVTQSFDLSLDVSLEDEDALEISFLGKVITLQPNQITALGKKGKLTDPLTHLRILADITSIEIFANQGELTMAFCVVPPDDATGAVIRAKSGKPEITEGKISEVKSIW